MGKIAKRLPSWKTTYLIFVFAPIFLGLGYFFTWFNPNPSMMFPALAAVVLYYATTFHYYRQTSGFKSLWRRHKKGNSRWQDYAYSAGGFLAFFLLAFAGIYVTTAGLLNRVVGTEFEKEFTVSAFYDPHQRYCDYKLILKEFSRPIGLEGFCVRPNYFPQKLAKGSKVTAYGKESILGVQFIDFKANQRFEADAQNKRAAQAIR